MNWWRDHGTKILGAATAATQVIQATDPTVLAAAIGPKGLNYVGAFLGIMTIIRGVQNTNAQKAVVP
jgi:hypothetical protein